MEKKDEVFDLKIKFLYQTARSFTDCYKDAILEAYDKVYAPGEEVVKIDPEKMSPANIMDDLVCVMYELEGDPSVKEDIS